MGRARRARKIAATAAYGGGGLAAASAAFGAISYGVIQVEGAIARRVVGTPIDSAPEDDGVYGAGLGEPIRLLLLGDSTAAGLGADEPHQTVGGIVANGVAALTGRRVRLSNVAVVGAESGDLERQVATALVEGGPPDVAVVMVGANDVTHRIDRSTAVRHLEEAVRRLREVGSEVIVGTCPDLGTIEPVPQPLRLLIRRWSRDLAAAQTVAVVEAGGRTVSLGDLLGPGFEPSHRELFASDRFHPSPAGYARVAAALLPSVCAALGVWGADTADRPPEPRRGEGVEPVAVAAGHAVREPGTEVSPTEVAGESRGPRGRWAVLLRRRRDPVPPPVDPAEEPAEEPAPEQKGTGAPPGAGALGAGIADGGTGLAATSRES
ncbi:MAG TPA: SGNH/GDSL hydrolase family protein [Dermatophilaceae bacterium]|nr:SGNH/GDSL hydrolase family protein [Dermatophilaceae bacterium]